MPPFLLFAARGGLTPLDYVVVIGYLAVMLGMGVYFSGRQTTSEEYFVGRRNMPSFVVGISIVATLLSTITYLAAPGDLIQHGLAFATTVLSVPLWLVVVVVFWVPFFMRYRLTSIYEYVAMRFNPATRALAASLFLCMRFGWMGVIVYTASGAVAQMTSDVPLRVSRALDFELSQDAWLYGLMVAMGVIATVYTFLGGIRVVIWTDVVQFFVMIGGAAFAIGYVWTTTGSGPVSWWENASHLERAAPVWFGFVPSDSGRGVLTSLLTDAAAWKEWLLTPRTAFFVILNAFFWRICTHCSDQVATQRYFTTDGVRGALRSNVFCAIGDFVLTALLGMVGLALLSFYTVAASPEPAAPPAAAIETPELTTIAATTTAGEHANAAAEISARVFEGGFDPARADHAKDAYPVFIVSYIPAGLAGLIMAALFAAAMSSIDSGINSISAVVTTDFYRTLRGGVADEAAEMRVARWLTVITGAAITGVAFLVAAVLAADPEKQNIIDLSIRVFNLFLGPLAAIFMVGIFLPHVGSAAMILATFSGLGITILLSFWPELVGTTGPTALLVTPTGTLSTILLAAVYGLILPSPNPDSLVGHTWWTRHAIRPASADAPQPQFDKEDGEPNVLPISRRDVG